MGAASLSVPPRVVGGGGGGLLRGLQLRLGGGWTNDARRSRGELLPRQLLPSKRQSQRPVQQLADQDFLLRQGQPLMSLRNLEYAIAPGHGPIVLHNTFFLNTQHMDERQVPRDRAMHIGG